MDKIFIDYKKRLKECLFLISIIAVFIILLRYILWKTWNYYYTWPVTTVNLIIAWLIAVICYVFKDIKGIRKVGVSIGLVVLGVMLILFNMVHVRYNNLTNKRMSTPDEHSTVFNDCVKNADSIRNWNYSGDFPIGQIEFQGAVPNCPPFASAIEEYEKGNYALAIQLYITALNLIKENYPLHANTINCCLQNYYNSIIYLNLGFAYWKNAQKDKALEAFKCSTIESNSFIINYLFLEETEKQEFSDPNKMQAYRGAAAAYFNLSVLQETFDDKEKTLKEAIVKWNWNIDGYFLLFGFYLNQFDSTAKEEVQEKENIKAKIDYLIKKAENFSRNPDSQKKVFEKDFIEFIEKAKAEQKIREAL